MKSMSLNQFGTVRSIAIAMVLLMVVLGVPFVGAQEDENGAVQGATLSQEGQSSPANEGFTVTCEGNPDPADPNEQITWTSHVSGGTSPYTYSWTGNGSFAENATNGVSGPTVTTSYHAPGQKNANVTVTSANGHEETANCDIEVQQETGEPLTATCEATPNPAVINTEVTWTATAAGGNGVYQYAWTGDGSFPANQTTRVVEATYPNPGEKTATVTVRSEGNEVTAECDSVHVQNNTAPTLVVSCSANPNPAQTGAPVTWSSNVSGGAGPYTYAWTSPTGDAAFPDGATTANVSATYQNQGPKTAKVSVTSAGETVQATCPTLQVALDVSNPGCNPGRDIEWTFPHQLTGGKAVATVHNTSQTCSYDIGLASYKKLTLGLPRNGGIQELFDFVMRAGGNNKVQPGESVTLSVDVPACNFQVDLFYGPYPSTDGAYTDAMYHLFDAYHDNDRGTCATQCPVPAPTITTNGSATANVGQAFSHDVIFSGTHGAPTTSGTLPTGLQFQSVNSNLYRITGFPTQVGTFDFTVSIGNECGNDTKTIRIVVSGQCPVQPSITSANPGGTFSVGQQFSYTVTTSGGTAPIAIVISAVGTAAPGLSVNGSTISGTFTTAGTYIYDVTVLSSDSDLSCATTQRFTLTVAGICPLTPPVLIETADSVTGTVGVNMSYTIQLSQGQVPLTYEVSAGILPPGLTLSGNKIEGTPIQAADATVTIRVANQCGNDTMTLRIIASGVCIPPQITSLGEKSGKVNEAFSYSVNVSGGTQPVVISIQGTLPTGLSFSTLTNTISGTPTQ
ncbi:MAG: putative Ig domain-containing protein, partial [Patescibacteria group bacterium]